MNSDMTFQTEIALQTGPVSDLGPHMEVVQIRIDKIRFQVVCDAHTVMEKTNKNRSESHVTNKTRFGPLFPAV